MGEGAYPPIGYKAAGVSPRLGWPYYDARRSVYRATPLAFAHTRAQLAKALAGSGELKIAHVGDSVTGGSQASRAQASSVVLRTLLKDLGYPAVDGLVLPGIPALADTRFTANNWVLHTQADVNADNTTVLAYLYSPDAVSVLEFTPNLACTAFDIYDGTNVGYSWQVDGGAFTAVAGGGNAIRKTTIAGLSNAVHTLGIKGTAVNEVIFGIRAYIPNGSVEVANFGMPGATTLTWLDTGYVYGTLANVLAAYAPQLHLYEIGNNDVAAVGRSMAQIAANIESSGTVALGTSDLALIVEPPAQNVANAEIVQQANYAAADALAVPLLDMSDRWASYIDANALGLVSGDGTHPNAAGYAEQAAAMRGLLLV